jgi:hypothetical protein
MQFSDSWWIWQRYVPICVPPLQRSSSWQFIAILTELETSWHFADRNRETLQYRALRARLRTVTFSNNHILSYLFFNNGLTCRSQWPRGLRCRSVAALLLRLWARILPEAWRFFFFECCVLSGRGLCDELIIRPEEFYRLWRVFVCDLETWWMRRPWPSGSCCAKNKQTNGLT